MDVALGIVCCAVLAVAFFFMEFGDKLDTKAFTIESISIKNFLKEYVKSNTLNGEIISYNQELEDAVSYLSSIEEMFSKGRWNLNKKERRVSFRVMNTSFYDIKDMTIRFGVSRDNQIVDECSYDRVDIASKREVEFNEYYDEDRAILERIGDQISSLTNNAPIYNVELGQNPYTITIGSRHPLFKNAFIRKLGGLSPIEDKKKINSKSKSTYATLVDDLSKAVQSLPNGNDTKKLGNDVLNNINKLISYCEEHKEVEGDFSHFAYKYLPTVTSSIESFNLIRNNESSVHNIRNAEQELSHTLEVFSKSTNNYVHKLMDNVALNTSVDQDVLEQQMIREGLYDPFIDN